MGRTLESPEETTAVRRREIFGYCMYDFANSSYTTLISTVAYSVYFRQVVVGAEGRGDFLWGLAQTFAMVIIILTSPVMGALADHSSRKKRFLLLTTIQTVIATACLFFVGPGDIFLGTCLYIVATVGFEGGYVFYNAFLREISTPRTIGRISGWSWGTGFIGGLLALVAVMPLLARKLIDDATELPDPVSVFNYRLSFIVVAGFFALFSIPTFLLLRETASTRPAGRWSDFIREGAQRVTSTVTHLRQYRETAKFVLAALFFYGGIDTVIKFSAIYAAVTFGIQGSELVTLFVVTNIIAVPGTLLAGYVADWIGGRRALAVTLALWCGLLIMGALVTSKTGFWIMAGGIAVGMGSTQAIGRSFMSQLSPPHRESEFFGFYILASKVGSIFSVLIFGAISSFLGSQRLAVISVLPSFIMGLILVLTINETKARQALAEAD